MTAFRLHHGVIGQGSQFASGRACDFERGRSPFSAGTLALQARHFRHRGFSLEDQVPGLVWATINVVTAGPLRLGRPDWTFDDVPWAADQPDEAARVAPETFSFVRCCLTYGGAYFVGLIYYPHPETKPATNRHDVRVLEILTTPVAQLRTGAPAAVLCREDAFLRL